jgi:beta-phosphoglucomutase family hydrolase
MNNDAIQAIIFDMDGTMIDNMPVHNRIWVEYLTEIGAQVDPETFHDRTAGKTNPEIMRMYLGDAHSKEDLAVLGEEKEIRYRKLFLDRVRPMQGLMELLKTARQNGLKLAIATSAPPENVSFVLGSLGLQNFFDAIVNGEEITRSKPEPEIFLKAAERIAIDPAHCLVFEDARYGVEAARRAGMRAIVVTTGMDADAACQIPGVWKAISNFQEINLEEILREESNGKFKTG